MRKTEIKLKALALSFLILTCHSLVLAEELKIKEPIVVNGDKVEYFHEKKQVIGSGNVSITYKDVVLTCERITVYLDTKEAIAEGNVKIIQKGAYFTGDRINYNFDTRIGKVLNGYINSKPFYGRSEEIDKVSEKQVNLKRGYVTTCDLDHPHYRVQARQVRIYLDDKVIAKHILFFIGNMPVIYLPYYVQPIKERSAHGTLQVGKDENWGYYALMSYRYYFSEIAKGRVLLDYRTKKGLSEGVENYYSVEGLGKGSAKFYYINENDSTAYAPSGEVESKYRVQVRHKWDMGQDTLATFEFNKVRDQNFIKDYLYKEFEEAGEPDNYISLITTKENYTASFLMRKRFDKYFTVVERLPEFKIDVPSYRIVKGGPPVYYKTEMSGVYLNKAFVKDGPPDEKDIDTIRFDKLDQLSYAARIFKALSITPYAGARETFYSRNKWGDTNLLRSIFTAGVDSSMKFYKIYEAETSLLGLEIHNLRHIITPIANYYYTHQPTISPDNLNQFDEIDSMDTQNGVKLSLENKLQTKRGSSPAALKSVDLATLIVSSDYAFRLKKDNIDYKSQKFKSVDFQLELTPYPWLYSLSKMSLNTKSHSVETASIDLVARKDDDSDGVDDRALGLGYRYENISSGKSNLLTLDATYKLTDKWKVRAYERMDIQKGSFQEQEYTVYRDLHCWRAEFVYNIKADTKEQTFWIVFRLKAFPDYPIGFKRTYYRPSFGATGA